MSQRDSIKLTPEESRLYLEQSRRLVLASNGRDGYPHLVAMWYVVRDGELLMTTYGKSQKAVNLRRDPKVTVLLERGEAYNQLRGLMIRGRAEIVEDPAFTAEVLRLVGAKMSGVAVSQAQNRTLIAQAAKRVAIRIHPERYASWDHAKTAGAPG